MGITVAADPELVVVNSEGKPVPCVGILPGSKEEPFSNEFGEIMEDNVLAEFTINPQDNEEDFSKAFDDQINALTELLKPHGLSIDFKSSINFEAKELQSEQAQVAGCDPDYNAWIPAINEPVDLTATTLRTAAGHIHMDIPNIDDDPMGRIQATKACDLLIGVPLALISNDIERRKLYGGAGAHRPKSYGIEYRVPDNSWIKDPELRKWVFRMVNRVVRDYQYYGSLADGLSGSIIKAINEDDINAAKTLYDEYCPEQFPKHLELRA